LFFITSTNSSYYILINSRIAKHLNLQVYYTVNAINNNFPKPRSRLSLTKSFLFWEAKGARRFVSETQYRLNNVDTLKVCFMLDLWQRSMPIDSQCER